MLTLDTYPTGFLMLYCLEKKSAEKNPVISVDCSTQECYIICQVVANKKLQISKSQQVSVL